mgnify:CR=1 FL=1
MSGWPNKEWREYSKEEVYSKRDLMMLEIHSGMQRVEEKVDAEKAALIEHKKDDKEIHDKIDKKIGWILKIGVIALIIVAANGGMEAIKTLLKIG